MYWRTFGQQLNRRSLFRAVAGLGTVAPLFRWAKPSTTGVSPQSGGLNRNSVPSDLKISDMRACTVAANYEYPIIRVDTNQGVYGR